MKTYKWTGLGDFDYLGICNDEEIDNILMRFRISNEVIKAAKLDVDMTCILLNTNKKEFSFIPYLSFAFGGMYGPSLPFSNEEYTIYSFYFSKYKYNPFDLLV